MLGGKGCGKSALIFNMLVFLLETAADLNFKLRTDGIYSPLEAFYHNDASNHVTWKFQVARIENEDSIIEIIDTPGLESKKELLSSAWHNPIENTFSSIINGTVQANLNVRLNLGNVLQCDNENRIPKPTHALVCVESSTLFSTNNSESKESELYWEKPMNFLKESGLPTALVSTKNDGDLFSDQVSKSKKPILLKYDEMTETLKQSNEDHIFIQNNLNSNSDLQIFSQTRGLFNCV